MHNTLLPAGQVILNICHFFGVSSSHRILAATMCFILFPDLMKSSSPSRIVSVSSVNHKRGKVDFSNFHGKNLTYRMDQVYNNTKLHNIICTNELARRLKGTGRLQESKYYECTGGISPIGTALKENK